MVYLPQEENHDLEPTSPTNKQRFDQSDRESVGLNNNGNRVNLNNYKGFHNNSRSGSSIPPLSHPMKPKFRKKGGSLLGKLIYSNRKDSDASGQSAKSSVSHASDASNVSNASNASHVSNNSQNSDQLTSLPNFLAAQRDDTEIEEVQPGSRNASVGSNSNTRRSVSSSHSSGSGPRFKFRLSLSFDHGNPRQRGPSSSDAKSRNNSGDSNDSNKSPLQTRQHSQSSTLGPNTSQGTVIRNSESSESNSSNEKATQVTKNASNTFDLDTDLSNLEGIVKTPTELEQGADYLRPHANSASSISPVRRSQSAMALNKNEGGSFSSTNGAWKAPDSWDVKAYNFASPKDINETNSDSDSDSLSGHNVSRMTSSQSLQAGLNSSGLSSPSKSGKESITSPSSKSAWNNSQFASASTKDEIPQISKSSLPVLYGSKNALHVVSSNEQNPKAKNYIVRVFREDNTFTTILSSLDVTTAELLISVQKKFFLESTQNYQLALHIGKYVKILEPYERPMKIQKGLLLLSGYKEKENLRMLGSEDLSYICKFVLQRVYLRNLTHEEETSLSKDYVNVDISGLNLKNIPIIFHQHTYEIETLNVADNPAIYIPLDFIQSCNYLSSITFSRNGCSKFPTNFLEARSLKYLDMEKNFLDELPPKFGHLKDLKHLKLNSNQLNSLPKSFSKLVNLESLNLSSNYFNSYPDPISDLVNLKDLDLSYNDLNFIPKSIGNLKNLSKLNLSTNKLSKTLPDFFSELINLKRLDIRYNYITNIDILGSLPKLEALYASKNYISKFSDKIQSFRLLHFDRNPITNLSFNSVLSKLTVLDFSKAKLTIIPPDFFDKILNVEKLVLDKNHLVNLPDNIGSLRKLSHLSLFGNNLQALPSTVGNLLLLQYLDLHSNNIQVLPEEIWHLKSLKHLNVSSNILTSFPKFPMSLAKRISSSVNLKLEEEREESKIGRIVEYEQKLFENGSDFTNGVKDLKSLGDSLQLLALADNRLTDECFNSISLLTNIKILNLSHNDIYQIPEGALRNMSQLSELYISGNELTNLPTEDFEGIKMLKLLFVNNNKLVSLPAELSKFQDLEYLDVGSNQLKYNISNWPYDWSWHWNKNLKYLNFSGNKRFEIKQTHIRNPETDEYFDSLLVLKKLKVLGLIDVTLTTTAVPEQNNEMRIRTTASELDNIGYGVSDSMGVREYVSSRDVFIQKFRGKDNETLFASIDGKRGKNNQGHRISSICKTLIAKIFADELNKLKNEEDIEDAMRRSFLMLNKEINGVLAAKKSGNTLVVPQGELSDLNILDDGNAGCSITLLYIRDKVLYTANIGDVDALLSRNNGEHKILTSKHDPTIRSEFERIRASGGYVSGDGTLDGDLPVSRGAGFFNYLPHLHSGPDITKIELTDADDTIVMATKVFWDYIPYELAVDIIRSEKDDPMIAAQKLRDFAISYGASDKLAVTVISLGDQVQMRQKNGMGLYKNLGRENELFSNKKRRPQGPGDSTLRMLDDEIEAPVGELALVFTDIKNSTLLWDTYPVAMRSAIKIHNSIMRRQLRIVGGYEVKTEGDAFMVSFPSPTAALLWCFNVQQQLLTADWPVEILETDQCFEVTDNSGNLIYRGLSVRMGIHWGSPVCELDVVTRRMDYFGPIVNRASRISAIADGGHICISSDFYDEIQNLLKLQDAIKSGKLTPEEAFEGNIAGGKILQKEINQLSEMGVRFYALGEKKLKGLEAPEYITLVYPEKLSLRFELLQNQNSTVDHSTRIFGAIPIDSIYGLRTISLRLERILLSLNGSHFLNEFQENSSEQLLNNSSPLFQEHELLGLFNHIVIRIENCVAVLHMRQQISSLNKNKDNLHMHSSTDALLDELTKIITEFKQLSLPST